jgi:hypothetical protein
VCGWQRGSDGRATSPCANIGLLISDLDLGVTSYLLPPHVTTFARATTSCDESILVGRVSIVLSPRLEVLPMNFLSQDVMGSHG